jgi:aryl sulfotransferase
MRSMIWLASYPKSGNTWVRAFLAAHATGGVNWALMDSFHSANVSTFHEALGVEAGDLSPDDAREGRPDVYAAIASQQRHPVVAKVHDAFGVTPSGRALFPESVTRSAVYVVRHPLDVVVSWAHHAGVTFEDAVNRLCDTRAAMTARPQLRQHLGSWSNHVASWLDQTEFPVHLIRYEDLLNDGPTHFGALLDAIGRETSADQLTAAIRATAFDRLQAREMAEGFSERPSTSRAFFRAGRAGQWREVLTVAQVRRICESHGEMMRRLSYSE